MISAHRLVAIPWAVLAIVWLAAAFTNKRTARRQPTVSMIVHIALLALAFNLMFGEYFRVGFLRARFMPGTDATVWLGLAATLAGTALAIWARFYLGRNWSGTVTVKQDHTLVRRGPYTFVRHPIYSGLSLAMFGTALAYGEVRCLVAAVLVIFEWKRKSLLEERFMIEQFGAQYVEYRREVKALVPYVW